MSMVILGVETSCDETAVAVVKGDHSASSGLLILSNVVASSVEMHEKTGGIVPEQAARQQIKSIIPVIKESLSRAGLGHGEINAIALTTGPGLIGSLLVGVETAKTLSFVWKKPIIPVNHLVAHIYASFLTPKKKFLKFPALSLIVSGGHTDLVLVNGHGNIKWLGGTRDDAAGEAFDKIARLIGLPYPGGPAISEKAEKYLEKNPKAKLNLFPRPMIDKDNFDFSFSGLKTAVANKVKGKKLSQKEVQQMAAETQEAIVEVLVTKTIRAVKKFRLKSLVIGGGVAANTKLRERLLSEIKAKKLQVIFHVPPANLCTDNAAAIAAAAFFNRGKVSWEEVSANPGLSVADSV